MGRNVQQCRESLQGRRRPLNSVIDENRDPYPPNFVDVSRASLKVRRIPLRNTSPKLPEHRVFTGGADDGIRTRDLLITNQLLYQLSYVGAFGLGK